VANISGIGLLCVSWRDEIEKLKEVFARAFRNESQIKR
jgi:hypothetical protein